MIMKKICLVFAWVPLKCWLLKICILCMKALIVCLKIFNVVHRPLSTAGCLSVEGLKKKSGSLVSGTLRESKLPGS